MDQLTVLSEEQFHMLMDFEEGFAEEFGSDVLEELIIRFDKCISYAGIDEINRAFDLSDDLKLQGMFFAFIAGWLTGVSDADNTKHES